MRIIVYPETFPVVRRGFYVPDSHPHEAWPCDRFRCSDVASMHPEARGVSYDNAWGVKRGLDEPWELFDSEADARRHAEGRA